MQGTENMRVEWGGFTGNQQGYGYPWTPTLLCKLYTVLYSVHCTVHCTLYSTVYTVKYSVHCTVQYILNKYSVKCTVYTVHCISAVSHTHRSTLLVQLLIQHYSAYFGVWNTDIITQPLFSINIRGVFTVFVGHSFCCSLTLILLLCNTPVCVP